jgi:hypothetical protein
MIPGAAARVRPVLVLDDLDPAEPPAWPDPRDHRDRGHFLTSRLYPTAPFDPWEPAAD